MMRNPIRKFFNEIFPGIETTVTPAVPPADLEAQPISPWILQQLVKSSPFGMMLVDVRQPDMPITYVNAAYERLTGYSATEAIGRHPHFLQGEYGDEESGLAMRQALENGESCTVVMRNYRKDGAMFWNEAHFAPIRDEQGQVTHYVGKLLDITARKEAELAVARSEARYHQMFDSHSAVKLVVDPNTGRIADANAAAADFYGYSREQLRAMRLQDIHTLPEPELFDHLQTAAAQEQTHYEVQHRLASGEIRDVDVYISPVDTPEGCFNYAIVVDVTAKRQAERCYRSLFEQSNDAVFILDLDGSHVQANARAAEMLGYSLEEMTSLGYRDTVEPLQQPDSAGVFKRLLAGERISPYQRVFRCKDGSQLHGEINIEVIRDADEKPLHFQSIVRDITRRKRMEEALRLSEERYRAAIEASMDAYYLLESVRSAEGEIVDFCIVQVNRKAVVQMGLPRETLIGGLICELFPINRTGGFFERFKKVAETGAPLEAEYSIPPDQPAPGWYRHQVVRVGDGVAIMNHDITARKQAEEALHRSEERLRVIIENIPIMIGVFGKTGRFEYVNPAWIDRLGWTVGELAAFEDPLSVFYSDPAVRRQGLDFMLSGKIGWRDFETQTKSGIVINSLWANVHLS
ncbi:MAG: PAS domain S-box protein [Chloroflexi bacterium]|nr:PAS domain S-box protein [Chloroflexota bacterium]